MSRITLFLHRTPGLLPTTMNNSQILTISSLYILRNRAHRCSNNWNDSYWVHKGCDCSQFQVLAFLAWSDWDNLVNIRNTGNHSHLESEAVNMRIDFLYHFSQYFSPDKGSCMSKYPMYDVKVVSSLEVQSS